MVRPGFSKPQSLDSIIENKFKAFEPEIDKRIKDIILKDEKDKQAKDVSVASKVVKAFEDVKKIKEEEAKKGGGAVPVITGFGQSPDIISCPTCHQHLHTMEQDKSGLNIKCTGPECKEEFILINKNADHKCVDCGLPIKKPKDPNSLEACPSCGSKKAVKYDWTRAGPKWLIKK